MLNHALGRLAERRRDRRITRGAARLLMRDVMMFGLTLSGARAQNTWPPDGMPRPNVDNWHRLAPDVSTVMGDGDDFEALCIAFESMEDMLRKADGPVDAHHLQRMLDRDVHGALEVLQAMQR